MRDNTPLPIKQTDIQAFQSAYRRRFGVDLDDLTARRELTRLVRLVALICEPTTEADGTNL